MGSNLLSSSEGLSVAKALKARAAMTDHSQTGEPGSLGIGLVPPVKSKNHTKNHTQFS